MATRLCAPCAFNAVRTAYGEPLTQACDKCGDVSWCYFTRIHKPRTWLQNFQIKTRTRLGALAAAQRLVAELQHDMVITSDVRNLLQHHLMMAEQDIRRHYELMATPLRKQKKREKPAASE